MVASVHSLQSDKHPNFTDPFDCTFAFNDNSKQLFEEEKNRITNNQLQIY